jgi:anti-sigma regulatory factor (Ser/Thr protein kinase)
MEGPGSTGPDLRHRALFYRTSTDYTTAVADFLLGGNAVADAAFVAVPADRHEQLRESLKPRLTTANGNLAGNGLTADPVAPGNLPGATLLADPTAKTVFADMAQLGRNPGRILPAIQDFVAAAAGARIRFVSEPIWPGRSPAEVREATRHEALLNLALAQADAELLCLYDAASLPEPVVEDACLTHPLLASPGRDEPSPVFAGPGAVPPDCDQPLSPVPRTAQVASYRDDLRAVRQLVAEQARQAALPSARAGDFVLAASEVAANTLRHTDSGGTVSLWQNERELLCQLTDTGYIKDPLAGRRAPDRDRPGGHGLWLVHQVCDLVELRTSQLGTTVRLHIRRPTGAASA